MFQNVVILVMAASWLAVDLMQILRSTLTDEILESYIPRTHCHAIKLHHPFISRQSNSRELMKFIVLYYWMPL